MWFGKHTLLYVFYNHLIPSGTKIELARQLFGNEFYNHLIPSGTKIWGIRLWTIELFYNHLIPSGTKISKPTLQRQRSFTIT